MGKASVIGQQPETFDYDFETHEEEGSFAELLEQSLRRTDFERVIASKLPVAEKKRHAPRKKPNAINEQNTRTVDLHRLTKEEAIRRVQSTLITAQLKHESAIIIITGKGHHSVNGPVLKPIIRQLMVRYKSEGSIRGFETAPQNLGGEGRLIVYL